ncbi:hypothetical protein QO002_003718 [Pararhizobium capsulatum DSM 1112]|uniref:Uncharacterized protein n=1 Tax=Pararhizobium capsulatum DSM 1112 TaxID=1121113 RepID=A0ABU0BTI7_9HYPH|nr:hypothetical protein [Pararhizobium capsulatum]MDQ0321580.1 hypothetical protein [Pararhizobium capsulatum DSM 1112]
MTTEDFTEYERRLAIDHERQWRALMSKIYLCCERRKCRRDHACTGPMHIAPCLAGRVKTQQAIGLSGKACARLPRCLAFMPAPGFAEMEKIMDEFRGCLTEKSRLPRLDRCREQTPQSPPDP